MKNTGTGETSTVEQSKVDDPIELTNKNDINRLEKMKENQKLKVVPIDTPLYKNVHGYFTPMTEKDNKTKEIKLNKGDIVTYKGKYEKVENQVTKDVTIYLEVELEDGTTGYLKLSSVTAMTEDENSKKEENKNTKVSKVTSRAGKEEKYIGKDDEKYVIAIAAGRNNESDLGIVNEEKNLVEEELTIKVSEKVEKLLGEYSNIKVIQTGSTADNPNGVKPEDRTKKAQNANPNLCIQIYFRDGDTAGVETIYKQGDDISQQLAEILSNKLSSSMGLTNLGAGTDKDKCKDSEGNSASLSIIENAAITGYPSVVAMGGNLNKDPDASLIQGDGTDKYAQAIVKSIDEYFKADHSGLVAVEDEKTTYKDSIESRIINMKYVTQEKLQEYIDKKDFDNAIKSYTIDDDRNVVIVSWSQNEDGTIELKTNNSMSLKTALSKYTIPYEYLLYFYIDTDYEKFTNDLADEVINNSEIVIAVQDNVTTTNTIVTTMQRKDATVDKFDEASHQTNQKNTTVESVSTSVNITYVKTWCVKAYQQNSYSKAVLEIGDEEEKIVSVPGKVTETQSSATTSESAVSTGQGTYTEVTVGENGEAKQEEKTYDYTIYEYTVSNTHSISNTYEKGEYKTEGRENVFVDLYNKHEMNARVRTSDYLFQIIENNEKTANLLDLTKYLIYKATNIPWGVLEFDYSMFDLNQFTTMNSSGGLDQFKRWLHEWEGINGSISADGTKYIIGDDGYGHPTVGYGIDIFNGGFADRFREAGYSTSIGAEVDKEFVDSLEDEEINNAIKAVDSKCSGLNLTQYQKYALVSRIFNCGEAGAFWSRHGKDFIAAFSAYWNQDTDLEYKVAPNNQMYSHPLYTNYMCEPNTAAGAGFSQGLVNRRKAEWLLFKTGYYDRIDEYYEEGRGGGNIVETAATVHDYIYSNGYSYSLNRSRRTNFTKFS